VLSIPSPKQRELLGDPIDPAQLATLCITLGNLRAPMNMPASCSRSRPARGTPVDENLFLENLLIAAPMNGAGSSLRYGPRKLSASSVASPMLQIRPRPRPRRACCGRYGLPALFLRSALQQRSSLCRRGCTSYRALAARRDLRRCRLADRDVQVITAPTVRLDLEADRQNLD
jgi:hypothetical protein